MIDWDLVWDFLSDWWEELPVRLWCVMQTLAAAYAAWAVGEPFGDWLFDPGGWSAVWGGLVFFLGFALATVLPVLLKDFKEIISTSVHLWCLVVMAGSAYLAVKYGSVVGTMLFPSDWQGLGPFLTWVVPCAILVWPPAVSDLWDLDSEGISSTAVAPARAVVVITRIVIRRE